MSYKTYILIIIFLALIIPPFLVGNITDFISLYGVYIFIYSMTQMLMAHINRAHVSSRYNTLPVSSLKYNILVVGYREDPEIFLDCMKSVKELSNSSKIQKIIVVIDGDSRDDYAMTRLFNKIFPTGDCITGDVTDIPENRFICINQKHAGKRHVLYTGLRLSVKMKVFGVLCTDSDTKLDKDCLDALSIELEASPDVGAVTGDVRITNSLDSLISFMSSIRYWFACNIERSYQSFNGNVLCVSGPLGVYRVSCISKFLDLWLNQKFMGSDCTYGDDRHLTNNILILGKKVKYTHLAKCNTDTPHELGVFFKQQTRWNKSSFREVLWTLRCLNNHSLMMGVDLIYQLFYSVIVIGSLCYIFIFGELITLLIYIGSVMLFNFIKGIYALYITKKLKYLFYSLYGFVYISILIPSRLYAALTMADTSWTISNNMHYYILGVWWSLLCAGLISATI